MRLDDIGPRTRMLAAMAGGAALVWMLALAGVGRHAPVLEVDSSLAQRLPQVSTHAAPSLEALAQYSDISARPLFSQDRLPKPFFLQMVDEEVKQNPFDYMLTSVLITPGLQMAFLQPPGGGPSLRVKVGETPEAYPGWRLALLEPRKAVFEGPEGRHELELRVYNGQGGEAPTVVAVAAVSIGPPRGSQPNEVVQETTFRPTPSQPDATRKHIESRRKLLQQQARQQPPAASKMSQ